MLNFCSQRLVEKKFILKHKFLTITNTQQNIIIQIKIFIKQCIQKFT